MAQANPTQKSGGRPPKPGPNYAWNGSRWIWVDPHHGNPTQKGNQASVVVPSRTPNRPGNTGMTYQQWADAQAQKVVDAQLAAIREQQDAYMQTLREEAARRAQQAQAFAQMVQGLGLDKAIQAIYSNAGSDIAGLAGGFAGDVRGIAQADAAAQMNMLSGTGQEGAVRNEGVGMGDVVYGVGGYIPGKTLGEQGAAFASDAARQPGFMLQQGLADSEKTYSEASSDANKTFLDAILQAKLGKSELSQGFLTDRQNQALQQQKLKLDQIERERKYWFDLQALYIAKGKYKLANQAEKRMRDAQHRYQMEAQGRAPDGTPLPNYYEDKQGRIVPKNSYYNSKGELVNKYKPSAGKGKGGLTPNAKNDIMQSTLKQQDDIIKSIPDIAKSSGWNDLLNFVGPLTPAQRKQMQAAKTKVFNQLLAHYGTIATTKEAKKALRKMIARLLNEYVKGGGSTGASSSSSSSGGGADSVDSWSSTG